MNILVIGGSYSGIITAATARKKYPEAQITLLEKKEELGFIPGTLNLILNKQMKAFDDSFFVSLATLTEIGVQVILGAEVTSVEPSHQIVSYTKEGEQLQTFYTKLILATGSRQVSEGISGIETSKIVTYKSAAEAERGQTLLATSQKVVVIGGGQVGMEMVSSLNQLAKEIVLIESMAYPLAKYFDREMLEPLMAKMAKVGVNIKTNQTVANITETNDGLAIATQKETIQCDSAVFALSVKPNLGYLKGLLARHADGTLMVNDYLQTSDPAIFAVGDVIQVPSSLMAETSYVPLVNNAVRTGMLVVENLEQPTVKFIGSIRTLGTKLFDYYLASTGVTETESIFYDAEIAVNRVTQPLSLSHATEIIEGKLIYNRETGRVLGAQLVSKHNILEKINTLALGIQLGVTIEELVQKDYYYHPAWNDFYDITNQLGQTKE